MSRHMISGSGKTTQVAEKALDKQRSDLVEKLEGAHVSTVFNTSKTVYQAYYQLGGDAANPANFDLKTENGWEYISTKAAKRAARKHTSLGDFKAAYRIEQYLPLSKTQQEALTQKKRTPAGPPEYASHSSLDALNLLR